MWRRPSGLRARTCGSAGLKSCATSCSWASPARESAHYLVRFEALADQIAIQSLELAIVRDGVAAAEALAQRRLDQLVVIDRREDLVHSAFGDRLADAGLLDLHPNAQTAAPP